MALSHLNCTTKERRIEIVTNYVVHADDCICLYGGQTVRSDANNRIISDRYYQFSCSDRKNGDKYVILCGSGAARHFCSLIGESLPSAFSPFVGEAHPGGEGYGGGEAVEWNATRRLLYYAIRLFIVRYTITAYEVITNSLFLFYVKIKHRSKWPGKRSDFSLFHSSTSNPHFASCLMLILR